MADETSIKYFYNPERNPSGAFYPGVPLADITEEVYANMLDHEKAYLDRHVEERGGIYRKTKPRSTEQREALKATLPDIEDDDPDDNVEEAPGEAGPDSSTSANVLPPAQAVEEEAPAPRKRTSVKSEDVPPVEGQEG